MADKKQKETKEDITFFHPDIFETPENAPPFLKGYKCKKCGKIWFPKFVPCPNPDCWSEEMEVVALSRRGKIYSYTDVYIGQPTMRSYMPMTMAYVDLPEGVRVFSQLEGEVGSFRCDEEVELVAGPVRNNLDGKPITGYKFKKISS
ncbi:Benzoylsuccinyl-CoA thiolase BbsA [uncultured Desulfobacterium sp.]|uniref:Benzoylsuccinyl-CoA thiolase BbsA n=1 Tax=uncultured Desulfobacterium sp. TaxID=201089 RepID=A0A445MYV6_9BACT|nr:Benzoylsuccinyl-CoA thiolase BbsA [uncultured Desulfobacterium sp.]